jgi:hypothetical protein
MGTSSHHPCEESKQLLSRFFRPLLLESYNATWIPKVDLVIHDLNLYVKKKVSRTHDKS